MDELIVRLLRGEASDIEARTVDRWRAAASENERTFEEARVLWLLAGAPGDSDEVPPDPDVIIARAEERRRAASVRALRRDVVRSPWWGWGLSAAAVAALTFVLASDRTDRPIAAPRLAPIESQSGPGDVVTMSLSDGSVVRLSGTASIEFPPDPDYRRVVVTGRAFFAVTESDRPFRVGAKDGEVTVVGTRFEVSQDGEGLRVVVVEGVVTVSGSEGEVQAAPGQVAFVSAGSAPRVVDYPDVWTLLDWGGGLLVFQATPLAEVLEEVSRYFGRPVTLNDRSLSSRRITAWFGSEPLQEVVAAVCIVAGARCDGDIVIER
jgi:transmembrane sensor